MTEQCEFESIIRQDLTSKEAEHDKRRKELEHDAAFVKVGGVKKKINIGFIRKEE